MSTAAIHVGMWAAGTPDSNWPLTDLRQAAVDAALGTVIDPELDEPITDLGFVTERVVTGRDVLVRLRPPTAFCSPSFAYLMVSDAHDAVSALDWVRGVQIVLQDHHDADRINAGIAAGLGFTGTYPEEAAGELDALRRIFQVKAHTAFIERVCSIVLREERWTVADLGRLRIQDLPAGRPRDGLCRRRRDLGMSCSPDDLVMVDESGVAWTADMIPLKLRFAKSVRISIDGNAHFCRGMLRTRYPDSAAEQSIRQHESLATDLPLPTVPARRTSGEVHSGGIARTNNSRTCTTRTGVTRTTVGSTG
jgi:metal-sulfur cluster biosynthetic enzyme